MPQQQQLWVHHNHTEISEVSSALSNAAFQPGETAVDWTLKMSCMSEVVCVTAVGILAFCPIQVDGSTIEIFPGWSSFTTALVKTHIAKAVTVLRQRSTGEGY